MFRMNETTTAIATTVSVRPPRLHWGWVLFLTVISAGFFGAIWMIQQSNWSRKVRGKSIAFPMSIMTCALLPVCWGFVDTHHPYIIIFNLGVPIGGWTSSFGAILSLIAIPLRLANVFVLRNELTNEPILIELSWVMTFFFGPVYFQYHLRDYQGARPQAGGLSIT